MIALEDKCRGESNPDTRSKRYPFPLRLSFSPQLTIYRPIAPSDTLRSYVYTRDE